MSGLYGCWNYDGFGNRTLEAYSTATSTPCAPGAPIGAQYMATPLNTTANNNQLSSLTYDGAGNVTQDSRNAYLYDPEGRICAVENTTGSPTYTEYLYDAEGRRVAKGSQTSLSCGAPTAAPSSPPKNPEQPRKAVPRPSHPHREERPLRQPIPHPQPPQKRHRAQPAPTNPYPLTPDP